MVVIHRSNRGEFNQASTRTHLHIQYIGSTKASPHTLRLDKCTTVSEVSRTQNQTGTAMAHAGTLSWATHCQHTRATGSGLGGVDRKMLQTQPHQNTQNSPNGQQGQRDPNKRGNNGHSAEVLVSSHRALSSWGTTAPGLTELQVPLDIDWVHSTWTQNRHRAEGVYLCVLRFVHYITAQHREERG